ncbi:hypothetical protein [Thalassolituus oleivorans]|uniref:hypothetical protein n=1 Tax=Thalassolituus oleivorans TaxID=187493 RepID=UPI00240A19F8|nr:hypothetical protein [Thalassolituus oleivorans]MDF1642096.1 hypothetical protein [Thalassolituus oleivorans]
MVNKAYRSILALSAMTVSLSSVALEAIPDDELNHYTGQAFITVDASSYSDATLGNYEFTRVNLGLDIETLSNADELRIGEFDRSYGADGTAPIVDDNRNIVFNADGSVAVHDADIIIQNFALGRVDNYNDPENAEIVPFKIKDPYIELAYKTDPGNSSIRRIAGVRIGFGQAQGDLSGDLISLTGNLEGEIRGPGSIAYDAACGTGGTATWFQCIELSLAANTEIYAEVKLLDGATGEATLDGAPYLKRASWIGVPTGTNFESDDSGLIASLIPTLTNSEDCAVIGVTACFRTTNYQSVYVGDPTQDFENGSASGAFISLQLESVPWEDLSGIAGATRVYTEKGAFLNIARYADSSGQQKYPLYLDLYNALTGEPRVATCIGRTKGC